MPVTKTKTNKQQAMPVFFLAHGSPTNALEENLFTQDWHIITTCLKKHPKPSAIIVFSAHWETSGTQITEHKSPPTIHDFGGFSPDLFNCRYDCPGSPALAKRVKDELSNAGISSQTNLGWGLDHGSWVILQHLFPAADIPVLQISLDKTETDLRKHYAIAQALKPFRLEDVLFIGSGNIVHNIKKWMQLSPTSPIDWAVEFDKAVENSLNDNDFSALLNYKNLPFAQDAVPSIEHFLPLIYCLGLHGDKQYQWQAQQITHSQFAENNLASACSRSLAFED